jgi:predicted TIM-barrel fold metal-dependent hydrolase
MTDHAKVRDFMIRYQDRIMYGSDVGVSERNPNFESVSKGLQAMWLEHWLFLATDQMIAVKDLGGREVKGLQLPAEVVDKIFSKNAVKFFNL